MAGSVNKVILVGNLGRDPEIRSTQDGTRVANLSLATSESWRDKSSGERRERTEWHRVVVFNDRIVDVCERFLKKGSKIYIEGALQTRKWTDQSGAEKYTTEVVLQKFRGELTMLDGRSGGAGGGAEDDARRRLQRQRRQQQRPRPHGPRPGRRRRRGSGRRYSVLSKRLQLRRRALTMTVLPARHRGRPAVRNATRRRFLRCAAALLAGTLISPPPGRISFAADSDAQWARLQRGLSQETMAGCRKAADRLMPRLGALLNGPQWESQTFKAIVDELKQAGVYPDHPPPRSPECAEAESLRGEAASTISRLPAPSSAGLAVAAAAVATVPGVGPVIAAVLLVIAAVVILIGQIIAKALEDQAAAKEGSGRAKKDQAARKRRKSRPRRSRRRNGA